MASGEISVPLVSTCIMLVFSSKSHILSRTNVIQMLHNGSQKEDLIDGEMIVSFSSFMNLLLLGSAPVFPLFLLHQKIIRSVLPCYNSMACSCVMCRLDLWREQFLQTMGQIWALDIPSQVSQYF